MGYDGIYMDIPDILHHHVHVYYNEHKPEDDEHLFSNLAHQLSKQTGWTWAQHGHQISILNLKDVTNVTGVDSSAIWKTTVKWRCQMAMSILDFRKDYPENVDIVQSPRILRSLWGGTNRIYEWRRFYRKHTGPYSKNMEASKSEVPRGSTWMGFSSPYEWSCPTHPRAPHPSHLIVLDL